MSATQPECQVLSQVGCRYFGGHANHQIQNLINVHFPMLLKRETSNTTMSCPNASSVMRAASRRAATSKACETLGWFLENDYKNKWLVGGYLT